MTAIISETKHFVTLTRNVSLHLSELALTETWPLFECWILLEIMGHILLEIMQFKGLHILYVILKNVALNLNFPVIPDFEEIVNSTYNILIGLNGILLLH